MSAIRKIRLVVLISGRGSNLQAILDQAVSGELPVEVAAVVSNRPGVHGLERARQAGVPALELDHKHFADRPEFEAALIETIDRRHPDLVVLAGFMRVLTAGFTEHYRGRLLNIHPSLLPKFRGLHTHERAIAAGETEHGASIHFVTAELDGGPVIVQARVPVLPGDDPDALAARVLEQEHRLYPLAIRWFAEQRLRLEGEQVWFDGQPLVEPLRLEQFAAGQSALDAGLK
ncbi:MAG: phosphoribosylglycinamide formyltransferase [Candidatus Competibacter phosphatis]